MISADRPVAAALGDLCPSASAATLVELARAGRVRAFRHHDAITSSDEPPRLVLLLEGHAGSWRSDPEGRRRLVAINGPGEFAGLTGLAASEAIELVGLTDGEAAIWGRDEVLEASRRDGGLAADLLELTLHASARLLRGSTTSASTRSRAAWLGSSGSAAISCSTVGARSSRAPSWPISPAPPAR